MDASLALAQNNLFITLVFHSVQRCRASEAPCRLSVSVKGVPHSEPPLLRVSISDTGVGSNLEEFLKLDAHMLGMSSPQWDGVLSIATTGMNDKQIQYYYMNISEPTTSDRRVLKLPSMCKTHDTFSGTEVCYSIHDGRSEEFLSCAVGLFKKMLILKDPKILLDLALENINGSIPRWVSPLQEMDDSQEPLSLSSIKCMAFGLREYSLRHGYSLHKDCETCLNHSCLISSYVLHREFLIKGHGLARNSERNRIKDQLIVEAVISVLPVKLQPSCWPADSSISQVFCFQDYAPTSQLDSCLDVLSSIDWPRFGLRLKEVRVEAVGKIVIEWEETAFGFLHIAIHCYHKTAIPARDISVPDRNLVKKAVKAALEDLKDSNTHLFLSTQAIKVREYVPDLSRSIASLILSSNDSEFKRECTTILGLSSLQSNAETLIESCISEKLGRIIEANDKKSKAERGAAVVPSLFECANLKGSEMIDEETVEADEDYVLGY